ncbi:MAG: hypothetical protein ACPGMR_05555 [Pontibacterium sp.]
MDKYALISFLPSVAVIAVSVVLVFVGIRFVKKSMAADAAAEKARKDK